MDCFASLALTARGDGLLVRQARAGVILPVKSGPGKP